MSSPMPARRTTLRSAVAPLADSQRTRDAGAAAVTTAHGRVTNQECNWRELLRKVMSEEPDPATKTTHDVVAAVLEMSRPRVSQTLVDGSPRTFTLDHVVALLSSIATRDATIEFLRSLIALFERPAEEQHDDDLRAQVISLMSVMPDFERACWAAAKDAGPVQLSFLLSRGEMTLRGVGQLMNSGRRVRARRGK